MIKIADRVARVKPSPTLATTARAKELKAQGRTIIPLSAGEPDFDTPEFIKQAARDAMEAGKTKYTPVPGTPELRQAIVAKIKRDYGMDIVPDQVLVSNGGKHAIFNALAATVELGDEVVIPAPYWVSYPDMVKVCDGTPVIVDCGPEQGFKMTASQLEAAITPKTKWLMLNSPSNPTGAVYTAEELTDLAEVLRRHPHVYVMSDDIYEHLCYGETEFVSLITVAPDLTERVLIQNGLSKAYSMTGWRVGYAVGPVELIKAMTKLQSQSTSNVCSIAQAAAVAALNADQGFLKEWVAEFDRRRRLMVDGLNAVEGLSCIMPQGAFYAYVSCQDCLGKQTPDGQVLETDLDLAHYLLEDAGVAVVGGTAFGLSPFFRVSYALSEQDIKAACEKIAAALMELR